MSSDLLPLAPSVPNVTSVATVDRRASRQDPGACTDFGRELSRELTRSSTLQAAEPTEAEPGDAAGSADATAPTTSAKAGSPAPSPSAEPTTDDPPTLVDGGGATATAASLLAALASNTLEMTPSTIPVETTGTSPTDTETAATAGVPGTGVTTPEATAPLMHVVEAGIAIASPSADAHAAIELNAPASATATMGSVAAATYPAEPPTTDPDPATTRPPGGPTSSLSDESASAAAVAAPGQPASASTPTSTSTATESAITSAPAESISPTATSTPAAAEPTVAPLRFVGHDESVEQPAGADGSPLATLEKLRDTGPVDHRPDVEPIDASTVDASTVDAGAVDPGTGSAGTRTAGWNSANPVPTATTPGVDRPTPQVDQASPTAAPDKGGALSGSLPDRLHVDHVNGPRIVGAARLLRHGPGAPATMTVTLDPASLGRVRVELTSHEGQLAVRLHAEQAQGVQAIGAGLDHLRDSLEAEGLRLADIGVGLSGSNGGTDRGTTDHRDGRSGGLSLGDSPVEPEVSASAIRPTRLADGLVDVDL